MVITIGRHYLTKMLYFLCIRWKQYVRIKLVWFVSVITFKLSTTSQTSWGCSIAWCSSCATGWAGQMPQSGQSEICWRIKVNSLVVAHAYHNVHWQQPISSNLMQVHHIEGLPPAWCFPINIFISVWKLLWCSFSHSHYSHCVQSSG